MVKLCRKPLASVSYFGDAQPSDFYLSSWQSGDSAVPMLVVRLVCLLLALAIIGWSVYEGRNLYWLLFLTNWGMVIIAAMFCAGLVVSCYALKNELPDTDKVLPWCVIVYWFLYNVSVGMTLLISFLYWVLLYGPELMDDTRLFWLEFVNHAGNSLLVMVEVLVSRTPLRAAHVYQPIVVGLWYVAFTFIYYHAGGTDGNGLHFIYDLLDWKLWRRTLVVVCVTIIMLILIYFTVYGIVKARDIISINHVRTGRLEVTSNTTSHKTPPKYRV